VRRPYLRGRDLRGELHRFDLRGLLAHHGFHLWLNVRLNVRLDVRFHVRFHLWLDVRLDVRDNLQGRLLCRHLW
jgi:hypothetical protein